jgi:hypothetical protein
VEPDLDGPRCELPLDHPGAPAAPAEGAASSGTFSGAAVPVECNVQIVADAQGRITDWDYIGGKGGCREPAKKLSQLALADSQ